MTDKGQVQAWSNVFFDKLVNWIGSLSSWFDSLSPRNATILGAIATAVGGVLWQRVVLPLLREIWRATSAGLYPVVSGAIILDRFWSLRKYFEALEQRLSLISNPWLDESQHLSEIFVPVSATTEKGPMERVDLSQVFLNTRTFVLIGDPGSGKTTALKSLAIACLKRRLEGMNGRRLVPVFIQLRRFAKSKQTLDEFIASEFENLDFPNARRLVRRLEHQCALVYLFDGIDEIDESDRAPVLDEIAALMERQRRRRAPCHVVATSRPVGYHGQLRGKVGATVEMADFNRAEIGAFVNNWDFPPPKSQEHLLSVITGRRAIFEICKNPLMLTIVTKLYRDSAYPLEDSREKFCRACIEALLRQWDEARDLHDRNKIQFGEKLAFLEEFAFSTIESNRLDFRETHLLAKIEEFLRKREYKHIEAQRFLTELLRSGLLSRPIAGDSRFAHKTLAESLAAAHLRGQLERLIELWTKQPDAWLEVCSLLLADPNTAEHDIESILNSAASGERWNQTLILAGEAHVCPERHRSLIIETLTRRTDLWSQLDSRAFMGIARLNGTHDLLVMMVRSEIAEVRTRAIYALGSVSDEWAVQLLGDLLVSGVEGTPIVSAIAAMGTDGLPIIATVIRGHRDQRVIVSAFQIIEQIGDRQTLEMVVPLLWSDHEATRHLSAIACARFLNDPRMRNTVRASPERCLSTWIDETEKTAAWILPDGHTPNARARAICARIVECLSDWMKKTDITRWDELKGCASFFIIAAAIHGGREWATKVMADDKTDKRITGSKAFARSQSIGKRLRGKTLPFHIWIRTLLQEIVVRSDDVNKKVFTEAGRVKQHSDSQYRAVSGLILILMSIVFDLPFLYAIYAGYITPWWLLLFGPIVGLAWRVWRPIGSIALFISLLGVFTLHFGIILRDIARRDPEWRNFSFFDWQRSVVAVANASGVAVITLMLGGWWWLCLLPQVATALWFNRHGGQWVFLHRHPPFYELAFALEGAVAQGEST